MTPRIDAEVALLRDRFPELQYKRELGWVLIPEYGTFEGWSPQPMPVAFQINRSHPTAKPYGFYVPSDSRYKDVGPQNFKGKPDTQAPFEGDWGLLSWTPEQWEPSSEIHAGSNLFNWVMSFSRRFREGA